MDLQSLWFAGEFGDRFTSTRGQNVFIRDFGIWNHSAGPDFTEACIQVDDQVLHGDIELDPDVRDWEHHGHGGNVHYNRVILHLFQHSTENTFFTRTSEHREVVQVQLHPSMLTAQTKPRPMPEARLGRCAAPLAQMEDDNIHSLLIAASQHRLELKTARLQALNRIHGYDQALYQAFAAALGYRPNQRPFTILAQRLPLKFLLKKSALEREALLFGTAGFLEPIKDSDTTSETRSYLRSLWSEWWKHRHTYETWLLSHNQLQWEVGGTRPGNHPQRRLGALVVLINHWKSVSKLLHSTNWDRQKFVRLFNALSHTYWDQHYTLTSKPAAKPIALFGSSRLLEILANIIYPWLIPQSPHLWEEYQQLHAVLDNHKIRRASLRLFGASNSRSKQFQKHLYQQQALLQLYEDFCLQDDSSCENCSFPEQLLLWR